MTARTISLEYRPEMRTYHICMICASGITHCLDESDVFEDALELFTNAIDFYAAVGIPVEVENLENLHREFEQDYIERHFAALPTD